MKTIVLAVLPALAACGASHPAARLAQAPIGQKAFPMTFDSIDDEENPYASPVALDGRSVGDWVTTELSNGGKPMTVQQRVLSRDGAETVTEVAIKDGKRTQTFRVRTENSRAGEQVLDVTRVEDGVEHATTVAAYDAAMQKTIPSVERNDGMLDTEPVSIDVGGRKVDAMRTTYKVIVAGKPATMSIVHADGFAWGDLGGDIVTPTGKTLYATRVTDTGSAAKAVATER